MNCGDVRKWLLESEDPRPEAWEPEAVADHLDRCTDCRRLAGRLAELEQSWRSMALPEAAQRSKREFLARLANPPRGQPKPRPRVSRREWLGSFSASAASVLALGAGVWLLLSHRRVEAADELLDELVDWNLNLAQSESGAERGQVYAERAPALRSALQRTTLPDEQGEVARVFLENAAWMAANREPLGEADRLDGLADHLLRLAGAAAVQGNYRQLERLLRQYNRVQESGVDLNLQRAVASGALDFDHPGKLERLLINDPGRIGQLAALLEMAPGASRKEIQRALGLHGNRSKRRPNAKPPRQKASRGRYRDALSNLPNLLFCRP